MLKETVLNALQLAVDQVSSIHTFVYAKNENETIDFLKSEIVKEIDFINQSQSQQQTSQSHHHAQVKLSNENFKDFHNVNCMKIKEVRALIEDMIESNNFDEYYESLENTYDNLSAIISTFNSIESARYNMQKIYHSQAVMQFIEDK
jgi:hypothetical protein